MISASSVWVGRISPERAAASLRTALDRCLDPRTVPPRCVSIKINVCDYRSADSGATTDPILLGILLNDLRRRFPSARLCVLENDASTLDIRSAYRLLGFDRLAQNHGAELHNVAEGEWVTKQVRDGLVLEELLVPVILEKTDIHINFAKLKTNARTKMTGCLKNVFAYHRSKHKAIFHNRIDEVLRDMNRVIASDVCLVDGLIAMEGTTGPAFGRPKRCGLLVAGTNPVSVDACCARIIGFSPRRVRHIRLCHRAGIGPIRYILDTEIAGFDYQEYKFRFEHWEYYARNLLRSRGGFAT